MSRAAERDPTANGRLRWSFDGATFDIALRPFGSGPEILFLPALSPVSSRDEWQAVAEGLAEQFSITLVDWPGFGRSSRLPVEYSPTMYDAFLRDMVGSVFGRPVAVIAAGHAAGYVLRSVTQGDQLWSRAVLVAPTWRGPLPTIMGPHPRLFAFLRRIVRVPGLGEVIHSFLTARPLLRYSDGAHVFPGIPYSQRHSHRRKRDHLESQAHACPRRPLSPVPSIRIEAVSNLGT